LKHRFLLALIAGVSMLTGVAYATLNAAAHTAAIGFLCSIVLKATELAHIVYRIFIGR
jgi:hypothetical protein